MQDNILALQQLFNAAIASVGSPMSDIKKVFYGDPVLIAASDFPALTIQPIKSDYKFRGSQYDEKINRIEIRLVYNAKTFFATTPAVADKLFALEHAINQVEQLVSNSKETAANTIIGVLRKNPQLPYTPTGGSKRNTAEIANAVSVDYIKNNKRGFPTFESVIHLEAIVIANR